MIYNDLVNQLKNTSIDKEEREIVKFLIGELQRADTKNVSDKEAIKILKKIKKNNMYVFDLEGHDDLKKDTKQLIDFINRFIPKEISEESIIEFVKTIDFTKLKNKNIAIGIVIKHFKGNVDGSLVKSIINNMDE